MEQVHKRAIVFGSLNMDFVYEVDHIVQPGETILSKSLKKNPGGKGLNQAIALARAGCSVDIAGKIGVDGIILKDICQKAQIGTKHLLNSALPTGNAIIQVDQKGQNSIVLFGGANQDQTEMEISKSLDDFMPGDYLFLQNEINGINAIIQEGSKRDLTIVLNPSPFEPTLKEYHLEKVDWFILNEIEICQIMEEEDISKAAQLFMEQYPKAGIVLTLGDKGSVCFHEGKKYVQGCYPCDVVDTTAAGDTFTGYFFAGIMQDENKIAEALDMAARAASVTISRQGAAETIPVKEELLNDDKKEKRSE